MKYTCWPAGGVLACRSALLTLPQRGSAGQQTGGSFVYLFISTNGVSPGRSSWFPPEKGSGNGGEVNTPPPHFCATRYSVAVFFFHLFVYFLRHLRRFLAAGLCAHCSWSLRADRFCKNTDCHRESRERGGGKGGVSCRFFCFPLVSLFIDASPDRGPDSGTSATEAGQMLPPRRRFRDTE